MKFTEENANAILAEKCSPYECPMCKQRTNFIFGKGESQILSFQREGMQLKADNGINFIPVIVGYCQNCGYVAQFNLNVIFPEK
mgnify:FL=1